MKRILRHFLIEAAALYLVSTVANGLVFEKGTLTFIYASVGITLATILGKPVINVMLLPLNLVTFGLFRWVSSAIALYIVTLIIPGFKITFFDYPGYMSKWFDIPSMHFTGVLAFVAFSFLLSLLTSFFHWLRR